VKIIGPDLYYTVQCSCWEICCTEYQGCQERWALKRQMRMITLELNSHIM